MVNSHSKFVIPMVCIVSIFTLSGCFGNPSSLEKTDPDIKINTLISQVVETGDTEWKYEKSITEPIVAKVLTGSEITLGDLEKNKAIILIPSHTFDAEAQVDIKTPDSVPKYLGREIKMLGSPLEITASDINRLNEPVTITFRYNANEIDAVRGVSSLRIAYYDGKKWEYIKPDSVDQEKQLLIFTTYHFSLFGANQIQEDTVISENWIHSKTLDKQMKDGINKVSDKVAEQIIDLTLEKMGISDKTLKGKVLADVLKDDGYKGIYDSYKSGDVADLNQKIALLAGKKIAEIAGESVVQEGLKTLTESSEDVAAISKAAGYIAGGQYKDAAKIIVEQIADKMIITAAGKIAVEVVDYQIESWKNNEIEAAYTAFRDGSNAKFYGYHNEKNDFDTVWTQMRGASRQLSIDAIKKENAIRRESGMPPLNEKQMDRVRESVKESYKNQFTQRSIQEEELKKEEAKLRLLLEAFKTNNLFDSTRGPAGLDKGLDYENKLNVLYHFAQKMMADTKRFELSEKTGLIMDKAISVTDLAEGARLWFTIPDGQKKYAEFVKSRFGISLAPKLSDLAGTWTTGTMLVKDVVAPPPALKKDKGTKGGCDVDIDFAQMKGKSVPVSLLITPSSPTSGTINVSFEGSKAEPFPFTYNDGILKGSITKDGAVVSLELQMGDDEKNYTAKGPLNVSLDAGKVKLGMEIQSKKVKPVKAPIQEPKK